MKKEFVSVSKSEELVLDGIQIETETVDGSFKKLILRDTKGHEIIASASWDNMKIVREKRPEPVKTFDVVGEILGMPVSKSFKEKEDAEKFKGMIESVAYIEGLYELKIVETTREV